MDLLEVTQQYSNLSGKATGNCIIKSLGNTGAVSNGKFVRIKAIDNEQTFFVIGLVPNSVMNCHCSNIGLTTNNIFEKSIVDTKINPVYENNVIKFTNRFDWEYFIVLSSRDFSLYIS